MTSPGAPGKGRVLVAVDGSEADPETAALAAREAQLRGCALHVVHVLAWPLAASARMMLPPPDSALYRHAEQIATEAAHRAAETEPELKVSWEVIIGQPLTDLDTQAQDADLLVLGSTGRGALSAAVESIAVQMSANASCPVLVQRGRQSPEGPVLLAVDGSEDSDAAAAFAFAEASLRGAQLLALYVATPRPGPAPAGMSAMDALVFEDYPRDAEADPGPEGDQVVSAAIAAHRNAYPNVRVKVRTERSRVRPALIDASAGAQLLVLGARGRGGFAGLLLGSVSQALLQHAQCPVAVVRRDTAVADRKAA